MSSVGARFQVRVRSPRVDPDIRQGTGSAAWTASAGDEASQCHGAELPVSVGLGMREEGSPGASIRILGIYELPISGPSS